MSEPHQDPAYQYKPDGAQSSFQGNYGASSTPQANTSDPAYNYQPTANAGYQPPSYSQYMGYGSANFRNGVAPEKPSVPVSVKVSVYLTYALLALTLITSIFNVFDLENILEHSGAFAGSASLSNFSYDDSFIGFIAVFSLVTSLIYLGVEVFFAVFAYKGANWARIVLTILLGLKILDLVSVPIAATLTGWMSNYVASILIGVLACVALVYLWLKPSSEYYEKMKLYKQWEEYNKVS